MIRFSQLGFLFFSRALFSPSLSSDFHPTFQITFICSCAVIHSIVYTLATFHPFRSKQPANMRFSSTILSLSLLALVASSPLPKKKAVSTTSSTCAAAATATSTSAASAATSAAASTSTVTAAADGSVLTASDYNTIQISSGTAGSAEVQ